MTSYDLANYFFYLTTYKIDLWFVTYLQKYNFISTSIVGTEYPTVTSPPDGEPQITFVLQMPTISVNVTETAAAVAEVQNEGASNRRMVNVFSPINTTVFAIDIALTMGFDSYRRISFTDEGTTDMATGHQTLNFVILPVANPTQMTPRAATLRVQYCLAHREDNQLTNYYLPLFLGRYTFISKSYGSEIPVVTDAPYPVTRNPLLPPKPDYLSPYGPSGSGGSNTATPSSLDSGSSNQNLIYGVVFGVLGAVILAAVGIIVVKVFIFKPDQNAANKFKYSDV